MKPSSYHWSEEETKVLRSMYADHTNEEIAGRIKGRTPVAIGRKAASLGLKKGPVFYQKRGEAYSRSARNRRTKTSRGYIIRFVPDHPYATKRGYVMEHRLVMERVLGRYLRPGEVVHHINGIKTDNRPENLKVMDHASHSRLHSTGRKLRKAARDKMREFAKRRFLDQSNHPSYKHVSRTELMAALREEGSPTKAAERLGVARKTIYNKLDYFGLREWWCDQSNRFSG